jgi:hypothetical protein
MRVKEVTHTSLARSIPVSVNEAIHGCTRILRGMLTQRVVVGRQRPLISVDSVCIFCSKGTVLDDSAIMCR